MPNYINILTVNYPTAQWTLHGDSYDGLAWLSDTPKPTKTELDALWESTQITLANQEAERKRAAAYVSESDPLFFKAQRGEATMEEWQAKVAEIKAKYPKQGSV
jgi:hypothetical protein